MTFDMNDVAPQQSGDLIPDGTFAKVTMSIRKGGTDGANEHDRGLLKASNQPGSDVLMVSDKAVDVLRAADAGDLLPRVAAHADFYLCRFCPFSARCWVEHDSVAWCAAFVGHCLEKAGIRSTRKLTARSYMNWGMPVEVSEAQPGDIGVIPRGRSSWQGHVFFVERIEGGWVWGLGGNQSDAVNIKRYPVSKLLGVRRAGHVAPAVTLTVREVQQHLRGLGYHEVGIADGIMGPRTRGAVLAFRDDNNLPLVPVIDVALTEALASASSKPVAPERGAGVPAESRIVTASNAQIGLGVLGAAGSVVCQIAPAVTEAEGAQNLAERLFALTGLDGVLSAALPWVGVAVFVGVIIYALKARNARIDDHRTGKTP